MSYCTQDDIEYTLDRDTLVQLTDDAGIGTIDAEVVARAIADADEEIDSALAVRYSLPLSSTPALVRKISVDLAVCNLYARRDDTLPETRAKRCDEARRLLDRIARGDRRLDVPDPGKDADYGVDVTTSKDDRIFTRGRSSDGTTGTLDNY